MLVDKPSSIRELGQVDISQLCELIDKLPDKLWDLEDERKENKFAVFHHTQHIVFRFIHQNQNHLDYYSNPIWDVWKPTLMPIMNQVIAPYGFIQPVFPKAMFARLKAGHIIDKHIDGAGSNLHTHKIHIPIHTNPQALFSVKDTQMHLDEGFAYEVNNILPHGVVNLGDIDRIHFIFEVFDRAAQ